MPSKIKKYETKPGDKPIGRSTEAEINQIAQGIHSRQIYTSHQCPPDLLGMVFMPVVFGGLENIDLNSLGIIWEWYDEAGPRSINGQPIFSSCHLLHKDDWALVLKKIRRIEKAMKFALGAKDDGDTARVQRRESPADNRPDNE